MYEEFLRKVSILGESTTEMVLLDGSVITVPPVSVSVILFYIQTEEQLVFGAETKINW